MMILIRRARDARRTTQTSRYPFEIREISGDHSGGETPVPIPNTAVKPTSADGTALATGWESRSLPGISLFVSADNTTPQYEIEEASLPPEKRPIDDPTGIAYEREKAEREGGVTA